MEPVIRAALDTNITELHYDRRERGGADENNWDVAYDRIQTVAGLVEELSSTAASSSSSSSSSSTPDSLAITNRPIWAMFMLSGNSKDEFRLNSTVARELGFAAHHAIHHMAMIKLIATNDRVGKLNENDLPPGFGRAPSTVNFDLSGREMPSQ